MIRIEIMIVAEGETFRVTQERNPPPQLNAAGQNVLTEARLAQLWDRARRDADTWVNARTGG